MNDATTPIGDPLAVTRNWLEKAVIGALGPRDARLALGLLLDAREDGHRVHSRQWHFEFPRNGT